MSNNNIAGSVANASKYQSFGMICPSPMTESSPRKAFPILVKGGEYVYLTYLSRHSHSVSATRPPCTLEFVRTKNYFITSETIVPKIINDGGTMRVYDRNSEGYIIGQPTMFESANGKLYMFFATYDLTVNPPILATDFSRDLSNTRMCVSEDYGDTWSEPIIIYSSHLTPSARPIQVGNEIWYAGYGTQSDVTASDIRCYLVKINTITNTVVSSHAMDTGWTNLAGSETALIEIADGRYMAMDRINWNANYPGEESQNKGILFAYSDDGEDWSEYDFINTGTKYPNQPHLSVINDLIYWSYSNYSGWGTYNSTTRKIDWNIINPNAESWLGQKGIYNTQGYGSNHLTTGRLYRYKSISAVQTEIVDFISQGQGSMDIIEVDKNKGILLAVFPFKKDVTNDEHAEPWISIIKTNPVAADYTNSYGRFLFMTEIPGDYHTSNEIAILNIFVNEGDTIIADWVSSEHRNIGLSYSIVNNTIIFTASEAVSNAKIVYEIIKA